MIGEIMNKKIWIISWLLTLLIASTSLFSQERIGIPKNQFLKYSDKSKPEFLNVKCEEMSSDKITCEFLTVKMAPKKMPSEKEFFEELKKEGAEEDLTQLAMRECREFLNARGHEKWVEETKKLSLALDEDSKMSELNKFFKKQFLKTFVDYTFVCETEDKEKIKKAYYTRMKFVENACEINWESSEKKIFDYDKVNNQWTNISDNKFHFCGRQIMTTYIKKSEYEYVPLLHDVDIFYSYPELKDDDDCAHKEIEKKSYVQRPVNYDVICKIGGGFPAMSGN